MSRHAKSWCHLNKRACFVIVALASLALYAGFTAKSCLVANVNGVLYAVQTRPVSNRSEGTNLPLADKRNDETTKQTVVRLVPLIAWPMLDGAQNSAVGANGSRSVQIDASPKYRLLRQQSLQTARRLPAALVIGVKKGGTRALLEFIRLHPDVRAAGSEVHFFDKLYRRGFNWYRRRMPPTLDGQVTMEKTPSYFVTREAPARVKQMNPVTKLMVVVRDPVTRAISDYAQAASKVRTGGTLRSFEELAFVNNGSGWVGGGGVVDTSWGPVHIGLYARHLERWLRHFPLGQMLFVSGERLIADPAAEMARVQDFLGLKRVVTEKHFYFNVTKGFPCLLKSEGRATPHCLGKTKGRNHPWIRPAALQALRHFYRPFNLRLYQLTGIDFGWP